MAIPHQFPSLVDGPVQVVLIAGTGLSAPVTPTLTVLKNNLDLVGAQLGVPANADFYDLADEVLRKLVAGGKSDTESRIWLAEALGMLDDRCWFGEIGLPLSGNTPRHRALARFAVEERIHAVVSLNWDALLEAALESVGLTEGTPLPRPWRVTAYARVVDEEHLPRLGRANVFPVIKPHGCVRELERARSQLRLGIAIGPTTFKLTRPELGALTAKQNNVDVSVKHYVSKCPLIGIGWKATEGYLRAAITNVASASKRTENDAFSLIDLEWNSDHTEIATAYRTDQSRAFACVQVDAQPTSDCLLQWLQTRYCLGRMITMTTGSDRDTLSQLLQEVDQPTCDHPVHQWADHWLPSWIRLCWRAGAMQGFDPQTSRMIGPLEISVTPRDAHIPLGGMSIDRRDLRVAGRFLGILRKSLTRFRFDLFPGGLWEPSRNCLYLPLPIWKAPGVPSSDLAALKPVVEALSRLGFVRKIALVCLDDKGSPRDPGVLNQLEAQLKALMPLTTFASGTSLSWIEPEAI
jgi:hypothetical protein